MKKFLFIAMAALTLMACGTPKDNPELPAKDKKAFDKATVEAVACIGQSSAKVAELLTSAGYVKLEGIKLEAPKRIAAKTKAPAAGATYEVFLYGLDASAIDKEAEFATAEFNKVISKGNSIILVYVVYYNDQMVEVVSNLCTAKGSKVNQKYTKTSDEMYATLPASALMTSWEGKVAADSEQKYTKHDDYVAFIAGAQELQAEEMAYAVTSTNYDGFAYICDWINPDEKTVAEQTKEGYEPYALEQVAVLDLALLLQD